jgi:hypothetical protein
MTDDQIIQIARTACRPFPWSTGATREIFLDAVRAILANPSDKQEATFEQWASDPIRKGKLPLEKHANGAYKNTNTYLVAYGFKSALKYAAPLAESAEQDRIDAERWRYAVKHWLDEHIATKQADEAIAKGASK